MAKDDIQNLVDQAMAQAVAEASQASGGEDRPTVQQAADQPIADGGGAANVAPTGIEMLGDVDLQVKIELGRTQMLVEDVLRLGEGSVVELDKLAGDPVDVYVNDRLVARGEVLVLNDNFCIRVSEIVANLEENQAELAGAGNG